MAFTDNNSTLQRPATSVKTADLNLDHDIAGEFEAAIDHSKLESKNKYDFMNLGGSVSGNAYGQSPFTADAQSAIRQNVNMRATGSIMGDVESRASSFAITPNYN